MILEHNSYDLFFRTPFGAVKTEDTVSLKLRVLDCRCPKSVKVCIFSDTQKNEIIMDKTQVNVKSYVFSADIMMPETPALLWYYFVVDTGEGLVYYGNNEDHSGGIGRKCYDVPQFSYQITVTDKNYETPDWMKGAIMYQIFPDRFYNGNENDEVNYKENAIFHQSWNERPFYEAAQFGGEYLANDFFGGNLKGIMKKLDYIKSLGVSVIYLNPIFESFSNHRYDTGSYENVDPVLGTNEDFIELCEKAEDMGIKIILDGVFSHTGSNSLYFNKNGNYSSVGAYQSKQSPFYEWYSFSDYPETYESWWGFKTLPNVNELNEKYRDYILKDENSIIKRWLKMGASGWRLDVVDELPDLFVKELRQEAKKAKKDALIIGEVWEDASNKESYGKKREYLLGHELDSTMNYPIRNAIVDFVIRNDDAYTFYSKIMSLYENYPKETAYVTMNLLSSHDIMRIRYAMADVPKLDRSGQDKYCLTKEQADLSKIRQKLAVVLQMFLIGAPCVYYGDEVGMSGYEDPFNRQTFPWEYIDEELLSFYTKMGELHNSYQTVKTGFLSPLYVDGNVFGFVRHSVSGKDAFGKRMKDANIAVLVNTSRDDAQVDIDLKNFGAKELKDAITGENIKLNGCAVTLTVPAMSFKIFEVK